jgi:hypothetical protein
MPLIPINYLLFHIFGIAASRATFLLFMIWYGLNTLMWRLDGEELKKAGHNRDGWGFWVFILVPAYLFIRAAKLKQNNGYAILWVVTCAMSVLTDR